MNTRRAYTKRNLTEILQDRARLREGLANLVATAAASIARHNAETYGLECFQTQDVAAWVAQQQPDRCQWPGLGRNELVRAIRQSGWTAKKLSPVYGLPMLVWVRGEER